MTHSLFCVMLWHYCSTVFFHYGSQGIAASLANACGTFFHSNIQQKLRVKFCRGKLPQSSASPRPRDGMQGSRRKQSCTSLLPLRASAGHEPLWRTETGNHPVAPAQRARLGPPRGFLLRASRGTERGSATVPAAPSLRHGPAAPCHRGH